MYTVVWFYLLRCAHVFLRGRFLGLLPRAHLVLMRCVCVCMYVCHGMASTGHTDVGMCDKNSIAERLRDDDRFSSCPLLDILNIIYIKAELFRLVQCQHTVI